MSVSDSRRTSDYAVAYRLEQVQAAVGLGLATGLQSLSCETRGARALYGCFNQGQSIGSGFASWDSWPHKSAATVTLTAKPFFGMVKDSLNSSGECWDLQGCAWMGDCRVSSDDRVDH